MEKKSKKLIIFGTGSFAKLMRYYFDIDSCYEAKGFAIDKEYKTEDYFDGLPVVAFEQMSQRFDSDEYNVFVAIGYKYMRKRREIFDKIKSAGYFMPNFISSHAIVFDNAAMGENNVFFPGVIIEPFVKINNNNIFWSKSLICHDCKIGSHNFFASGCIVGGFSEVCDGSFFGFNSTLKDNIKIENETLIGASSLVLKNTDLYGKYFGIPAKKRGEHNKDGITICD